MHDTNPELYAKIYSVWPASRQIDVHSHDRNCITISVDAGMDSELEVITTSSRITKIRKATNRRSLLVQIWIRYSAKNLRYFKLVQWRSQFYLRW